MDSSPYAPPTAELEQEPETASGFYVVALRKFTLLYFSTLGLYLFYWFYANWREYRKATGHRVWPVPRALFNILFTHLLFHRIKDRLAERAVKFAWRPTLLATLFVLLSLISNGVNRMVMREVGFPYSDLLSLLLLLLIYTTLVTPQKAINAASGFPAGESNSSLTWANYIWLVLGAVAWLMTITGYLISFGIIELASQR